MSLAADDVSVRVGGRRVLHKASLEICPGQLTVLVGPNGAGKSSLLRVLSGDLQPCSGSVQLDGMELAGESVLQQARKRAVMSQSASIIFDFRVEEILLMGWTMADRFGRNVRDSALGDVVVECDIAPLLGRTFNTLSGGEQRRVQFARALLQIWRPAVHRDTRYLLLDEPTANLDIAHELLVLNRTRAQTEGQDVGALVVLHDLNIAARFADRIIVLADGAIVAAGKPHDVLRADILSEVYQTAIVVDHHAKLDRLVVHS